DRFMRPGHRYLCYATKDRKPHGGPSAAATGVVASLAHAVHALAFADEADDRIRPAIDMQPLAVAHAVAVGCDVDHVAKALRLRHTISRLLVRDHDQTVVRQVADHLDRGAELRADLAGSRVDHVPQCHTRTRCNLDTVVTEDEYPHGLAHTTSHDRNARRRIRPSHLRLARELRRHRAGVVHQHDSRARELRQLRQRCLHRGVELRLELLCTPGRGDVPERKDLLSAALASQDSLAYELHVDTRLHHVAQVSDESEVAELLLSDQALKRLLLVGAGGELHFPCIWGRQLVGRQVVLAEPPQTPRQTALYLLRQRLLLLLPVESEELRWLI